MRPELAASASIGCTIAPVGTERRPHITRRGSRTLMAFGCAAGRRRKEDSLHCHIRSSSGSLPRIRDIMSRRVCSPAGPADDRRSIAGHADQGEDVRSGSPGVATQTHSLQAIRLCSTFSVDLPDAFSSPHSSVSAVSVLPRECRAVHRLLSIVIPVLLFRPIVRRT